MEFFDIKMIFNKSVVIFSLISVTGTLLFLLYKIPKFKYHSKINAKSKQLKSTPQRKHKDDEVAGLENYDGRTCYMNGVVQALASCTTFCTWMNNLLESPLNVEDVSDSEEGSANRTFVGSRIHSMLTKNGKEKCISRSNIFYGSYHSDMPLLVALNGVITDVNSGGRLPWSVNCVYKALTHHRWKIAAEEHDSHEMFSVLSSTIQQELEAVERCMDYTSSAQSHLVLTERQDCSRSRLHSKHTPFGGYFASQLQCRSCLKKNPAQWDRFDCVSLTLPSSSSYLPIPLALLLSNYTKLDYVTGVTCKHCSHKMGHPVRRIFSKRLTIGKLPEVLVLHINRSVWGGDFLSLPSKRNDCVQFPFVLDMMPYTYTTALNQAHVVEEPHAHTVGGLSRLMADQFMASAATPNIATTNLKRENNTCFNSPTSSTVLLSDDDEALMTSSITNQDQSSVPKEKSTISGGISSSYGTINAHSDEVCCTAVSHGTHSSDCDKNSISTIIVPKHIDHSFCDEKVDCLIKNVISSDCCIFDGVSCEVKDSICTSSECSVTPSKIMESTVLSVCDTVVSVSSPVSLECDAVESVSPPALPVSEAVVSVLPPVPSLALPGSSVCDNAVLVSSPTPMVSDAVVPLSSPTPMVSDAVVSLSPTPMVNDAVVSFSSPAPMVSDAVVSFSSSAPEVSDSVVSVTLSKDNETVGLTSEPLIAALNDCNRANTEVTSLKKKNFMKALSDHKGADTEVAAWLRMNNTKATSGCNIADCEVPSWLRLRKTETPQESSSHGQAKVGSQSQCTVAENETIVIATDEIHNSADTCRELYRNCVKINNSSECNNHGSARANTRETSLLSRTVRASSIAVPSNPLRSGNYNGLYLLKAVIEHSGSYANTGHFVTYRRGPGNSAKWYCTSDSSVQAVSVQTVEAVTPYMLFYERYHHNQAHSDVS